MATITLRHEFRTLEPEDARVLLFDGGSAPLAVFGPKLSQKAASSLDKLGVEQHMGSIVTHVDQGGVLVRDHARPGDPLRRQHRAVDGRRRSATRGRCTGRRHRGPERRSGRIMAEEGPDLIPGHSEISVLGDMMSLDKLLQPRWRCSPGCTPASRVRRRAAGNMAEKTFRYHDLGSAAYISRGRALVSAGPLQLSGFPGCRSSGCSSTSRSWTGHRNRIGALLTWWLAFARNLRRERAFITQQLETQNVYTVPPLGRSCRRSRWRGAGRSWRASPPPPAGEGGPSPAGARGSLDRSRLGRGLWEWRS